MNHLRSVGLLAGGVGALVCVGGAALRLSGEYWLAGFQVGTLLQAGTAAMVFGCFCLLAVQATRS